MDPLISITGAICSLTGYASAFFFFSNVSQNTSRRKLKIPNRAVEKPGRPFFHCARGVFKVGPRRRREDGAQSKQKSFAEGGEWRKSV